MEKLAALAAFVQAHIVSHSDVLPGDTTPDDGVAAPDHVVGFLTTDFETETGGQRIIKAGLRNLPVALALEAWNRGILREPTDAELTAAQAEPEA